MPQGFESISHVALPCPVLPAPPCAALDLPWEKLSFSMHADLPSWLHVMLLALTPFIGLIPP